MRCSAPSERVCRAFERIKRRRSFGAVCVAAGSAVQAPERPLTGSSATTTVTALTALATRVSCACRIILEVAAAVLAAFPAGFGRTLGVFCKVAFTASMFGHGNYSVGNIREK